MSLPYSDDELLALIAEAFKDIFDDLDVEIDANTSSSDIEAWDSLAHIQLVMSIENKLGVKFDAAEISQFVDVKSLMDLLSQK